MDAGEFPECRTHLALPQAAVKTIHRISSKASSRRLLGKSADGYASGDVGAPGIIVWDADERVVAWNQRFAEIWRAGEILRAGLHIRELAQFVAEAGLYGPGDPEELADARIAEFRSCLGYAREELHLDDGRVIWVTREPLPDGGRMTTYTELVPDAETHEADAGASTVLESEALLSEAIDAISDGFVIWDVDDRLLMCNERFREMVPGIKDLAVPGAHFESMLRAAYEYGIFADGIDVETYINDRRTSRQGSAGGDSSLVPLRDGRWILVREHLMKAGVLVSVFEDVTAMRQGELQLRTALESMTDGIYMLDENLCYVLFNPQYLKILDLPENLVRIGGSVEDVVHALAERGDYGPGNLDDLVAARMKTLRVSESIYMEMSLQDGKKHIEVRKEPTRSGGAVVVLTDITDRKKAETALAEKTSVLEITMEHMAQGILMLDADLRLVAYNKRVCELLGLPEELLETSPTAEDIRRYQFAHGEFGETGSEADRQVIAWIEHLRTRAEPLTYVRARPDGRHIEARNIPLPGGGWVRTFADITAHIHAQQELERARTSAEAANQAKSVFLANMSHEIRTPMNAISGMIRLALNTQLDDKQRDYLIKAYTASDSLMAVINNILDFSKIEAGRMLIEAVEFDLDDVLERISNIVSLKAGEKGIELIFATDPDVPTRLVGDPLRLEQVLTNLVGNAVKFTDAGEIVISVRRLSTAHPRTQLEFSVRDTGIGLTEAQRARLFEPFTQADGSTTRRYGGTGLGLAICKQIVELMGGNIDVVSEHGHGTTVTFTAGFDLRKSVDRPTALPARLQGQSALVVDDSPTARTVLAGLLRSFGFSVSQAASGEEAIEEFERAAKDGVRYRLVLMDWKMSGIDGVQAAVHIRQRCPENGVPTRIIMVTAYDKEELEALANAEDFDAVITKPVSASRLLNLILETESGRGIESRSAPQLSHGALSGRRFDGVRVLLVEDNEINLQIASEVLSMAGVQIEVARDGRAAVQRFESKQPGDHIDMVLMDLQMPIMDGFEATRRLRTRFGPDELPIVAMTAHAFEEERQRCFDAGMNDHVSKPIDPDRLLAAVGKWTSGAPGTLDDRPATNSGAFDASADLPSSLPGLDIAEGLSRVNGHARLYGQLLHEFGQLKKDAVDQIRALVANNSYDEAAAAAHALKGVAGNLSANTVHAAAGALETALRSPGADAVAPILARADAALTEVLASIDSLALSERLCAETGSGENGDEFRDRPLASALEALAELLAGRNLQAEEYARSIETSYNVGEQLAVFRKLQVQIAALEFDEARHTLAELLDSVHARGNGS